MKYVPNIAKGRYIVAVSGGVDSVVLLNLLAKNKNLDLIVAHFDHGIRKDSHLDREFVQKLAEYYELKFEHKEGKLGAYASEETARAKRYEFLHNLSKKYSAKIITAHHKDDVIETMIINILRGTGRRGLTSLKDTKSILRPFLDISKKQLVSYAQMNNLEWREDPTNENTKILRNYIRHELIPKMVNRDKDVVNKLFLIHKNMIEVNKKIDMELDEIAKQLGSVKNNQVILSRYSLVMLPVSVAKELVYLYLKELSGNLHFDEKQIARIVNFAKTAKSGKRMIASKNTHVTINKDKVCLAKVD